MATYRGEYNKQIDSNTGAFHVTDHGAKEFHDGNSFVSAQRFEGIANDASVLVRLKTGALQAHVIGEVIVEGNAYFDIAAFVTFSADGTLVYQARKNGNTSPLPTMEVYTGPTVDDPGTTIFKTYIPAGQRSKASGGSGGRQEWGLVPNSEYLITITNKSGLAADAAIVVEWIEHTDQTDAYDTVAYSNLD